LLDDGEVSVGRVSAAEIFDLFRLPFERQGIGPALVDTGAPATAHVPASSDTSPPQSAAQFWTPGGTQNPPAPVAPAQQP